MTQSTLAYLMSLMMLNVSDGRLFRSNPCPDLRLRVRTVRQVALDRTRSSDNCVDKPSVSTRAYVRLLLDRG